MKKKSLILLTFTLSVACAATFSSCFSMLSPNSSSSSGKDASTSSSSSSGKEDIKNSEALAEEVIAILQKEKAAVALANEMQLKMAVTANSQKQTMDFRIASTENVKTKEADLFLEGVVKNKQRTETMLQDVFVRDELIFSTDTYKNAKDKETQDLIAVESAEDALNATMGGLLGSEITLEGAGSDGMESFIYFAGEYGGLSQEQDAYVLDINETLYHAIKALLPTLERLDEETTVGELLKEKEVKRLIDVSCKDMTAGEFHDGLSSFGSMVGFMLPIKAEDTSKSVYEYLVSLTKTEGFMAEATEGDTLLYDATVDEVLQSYDSNVDEFVGNVRKFVKEGVEDGIMLSLGEASSKVEFSLNDFVVTYQVSGGQITTQEVDVAITLVAQGQTIEIELGVEAEKFDKAQTLTNLSQRNVVVTEYSFYEGMGFASSAYVAPHVEAYFWVQLKKGGMRVQVEKDGRFVDTEYNEKTGMYEYSYEGVEMLAKVNANPQKGRIEVELYCKDRPNELFNYFYKDVNRKEVKKKIPFDEFELPDNEVPSTAVVNGFQLKLNTDGESYAVTGFSGASQAVVNIPQSYDGKPITMIESNAFEGNQIIEEIILPSTIKVVHMQAFAYCPKLKTATIHAVVIEDEAFEGCMALENLSLFKTIRIGEGAFRSCESLKNVTLSENLYIVELEAFHACQNAKITLPKSLRVIEGYAFAYCEKIETVNCPNLTQLGASAFQNCKNLTSVTLPNAIKEIGASTFRDCEALTKLKLGSKVTSIGEFAFAGCINLEELTIPASVTSIGREAFSSCSIKELYLSNTVQDLGDNAFKNCANLESVRLSNKIKYLAAFENCDKLTSIELPSSLTELGDKAFNDCDGLVSIVIPEGVTKLGDYSFSGCDNLESVTLPESLKNIDSFVFDTCPKLKTLTLSSKIASIYDSAFANSGIETIVYNGTMLQWKNIYKPSAWNVDMGDVVIRCTDGKLNKNDEEIA